MSLFQKVTPEEEREIIEKAYKWIKQKKLETAALLLIRGFGPFSFTGSMMLRFFLGPLIPFIGHREDVILSTFESKENLDRLEKMLEGEHEAA